MTHALIAEETHTSAPPSAGARRPEQADPELPEWQRPDPGPDELRADVLGAIGLYLISVLSLALSTATGVFGSKTASLGLSVVVLAFVTLPLAVRRRWPTPVLAVVTAAFVAIGEIPVAESTIANVALFCALYTVGAWEKDRRRAVVARAAVVTLMVVWLVSSLFRISLSDLDDEFPGEGLGALTPAVAFFLMQVLLNILYFAGAWWFGSHSWNAARERALVEYRTAQLPGRAGGGGAAGRDDRAAADRPRAARRRRPPRLPHGRAGGCGAGGDSARHGGSHAPAARPRGLGTLRGRRAVRPARHAA